MGFYVCTGFFSSTLQVRLGHIDEPSLMKAILDRLGPRFATLYRIAEEVSPIITFRCVLPSVKQRHSRNSLSLYPPTFPRLIESSYFSKVFPGSLEQCTHDVTPYMYLHFVSNLFCILFSFAEWICRTSNLFANVFFPFS